MRRLIIHHIARLLGVLVKIDGLPFGRAPNSNSGPRIAAMSRTPQYDRRPSVPGP